MFIYLLSCLLVNCHYATGYQIKRDRPIEGERRSKYYRCSLTVKELKIRHRPFVVCYWNLVERKMPSVLQSISAPRRGVDGSVGITKVWRRYVDFRCSLKCDVEVFSQLVNCTELITTQPPLPRFVVDSDGDVTCQSYRSPGQSGFWDAGNNGRARRSAGQRTCMQSGLSPWFDRCLCLFWGNSTAILEQHNTLTFYIHVCTTVCQPYNGSSDHIIILRHNTLLIIIFYSLTSQ